MSNVEIYRRDDRVWIVVVGPLDGVSARRLAAHVNALGSDPTVRRVSVDATCALCRDAEAGSVLDSLGASASAWLDVTTGGAARRLVFHRSAA